MKDTTKVRLSLFDREDESQTFSGCNYETNSVTMTSGNFDTQNSTGGEAAL